MPIKERDMAVSEICLLARVRIGKKEESKIVRCYQDLATLHQNYDYCQRDTSVKERDMATNKIWLSVRYSC